MFYQCVFFIDVELGLLDKIFVNIMIHFWCPKESFLLCCVLDWHLAKTLNNVLYKKNLMVIDLMCNTVNGYWNAEERQSFPHECIHRVVAWYVAYVYIVAYARRGDVAVEVDKTVRFLCNVVLDYLLLHSAIFAIQSSHYHWKCLPLQWNRPWRWDWRTKAPWTLGNSLSN